MKAQRAFTISILLLVGSFASSGQKFDDESNWYKEIGRGDSYFSRFDFRKYTEKDVLVAKSKYLQITGRQSLNEWEGTYEQSSMLGRSELTWSEIDGFVLTYTYHTLALLDYGKVIARNDEVSFGSEKGRKHTSTLVKVLWGNKHILVPRGHLSNLALRAAGRSDRNPPEDDYLWTKSSDVKAPAMALPIYPKRFSHLLKKPIVTTITNVGNPQKHTEHSIDRTYSYHENRRLITLRTGRSSGVKVGMWFFVDDLDEWIEIVGVRNTHSVARLSRDLKSNTEVCTKDDREGVAFPCKPLRIGMRARTLNDEFQP